MVRKNTNFNPGIKQQNMPPYQDTVPVELNPKCPLAMQYPEDLDHHYPPTRNFQYILNHILPGIFKVLNRACINIKCNKPLSVKYM